MIVKFCGNGRTYFQILKHTLTGDGEPVQRMGTLRSSSCYFVLLFSLKVKSTNKIELA